MLLEENFSKIMHELKNNVTFISSSLQLIAKNHPEVESYDYWTDVMQEILTLRNSMIELSSAGLASDLSLATVNPNTFLSELLISCKPMFDPTNFICHTHIAKDIPLINIDYAKIKRAFWNLLKNSFEAMHEKGCIEVHVTAEDSFVRFDIIDFGGGFPADYLPKLFTPFETTKPEGTGLGLVITNQIINLHGGKLQVDSRPSDGCTFSIYLPAA